MTTEYYAHKDQPLPTHLLAVAREAERFGKFFGADGQAHLAGLLHDLGKAEEAMRTRILTDNKKGEKQPHAHHGAALALEKQVWPVAFAVNGHHAGLHDRRDLQKARKHLQKARDGGLYRLVSSSLYEGTLRGAGLDVSGHLGDFDQCL